MKITMLTVGTRGEVQPLVALGLGLQAAGHKVSVATHATFERFVRDSGLGFSFRLGRSYGDHRLLVP